MFGVIAREGGRSSIPETVEIKSRGRGVLDAPVKPGHDSGGLGAPLCDGRANYFPTHFGGRFSENAFGPSM